MTSSEWNSYIVNQMRELPIGKTPRQIEESYQKLNELAKQRKVTLEPVYGLYFQAYRLYRSGQLLDAVGAFFDTISACDHHDKEYVRCLAYLGLGNSYLLLSDYLNASEFLSKAESFEKFNDYRLLAMVKNNIGELFERQGKFTEALEYYQLSADLINRSDDIGLACMPICNQAMMHTYLNNMAMAKQLFIKAKEGFDALGCYHNHYWLMYSKFLEKSQHIEQASSTFLKAIEEAEKLGDQFQFAENICEYCVFILRHNLDVDISGWLKRGGAIATEVKSDTLLYRYNQLLLAINKYVPDIAQREAVYLNVLDNYEQAKTVSEARQSDYLIQLHKLNVDRVKLDSLKEMKKKLELISKIGEYISTSGSISDSFLQLHKDISSILAADCFAIGFYDETKQSIDYEYFLVDGERQPSFMVDCRDASLYSAYCVLNNKPLIFNDRNYQDKADFFEVESLDELEAPNEFHSEMFAPITFGNKVIGVLTVQAREKYQYNTNQQELFLQLTKYLTIAIENQRQKKLLQKLSITDHLTSLYNRQYLDEVLLKHIHLSRKVQGQLTTAMIDIDYFKQFNDRYGHVEGDKLLMKVAELLKRYFDPVTSPVFRYGGDEFFVSSTRGITDISCKMKEIVAELSDLHIINYDSLCAEIVSLSVGISSVKVDSLRSFSLEDILRFTDKALYKSKRGGRNKISVLSDKESVQS
ncbi:diguanylate cyclase [Aliivibrio kagoshimensis]|uniref:diguanylate cyclase n=1 Tax=Aliivibrio kagoshimensis TaxID=2910230 RepID=UPI003D133FC0